jgi:prepilin-type processing-associated H-X9-DG protein
MMRILTATLGALLLAAPALVPGEPRQDAAPKALADLLDGQTFAVVRLDFARVFGGELLDRLAVITGLSADELSPGRKSMERAAAAFTKAGGREVYAVASLADAQEMPFLVLPLRPGADEKTLTGLLTELRLFPTQEVARLGPALVAGTPKTLRRLRALKPAPPAELAQADPFAQPAAVEALLLLSPDNRRVLEELLPQLPPGLGGGPVTAVTRGLRWARLSGETSPPGVRLAVQARDEAAARDLQALAKHALTFLAGRKEVTRILPNLDRQKDMLLPRVEGDKLTLRLGGDELTALARPLVSNARRAALQAQGSNNLKQIGVALHNYYDTHKAFPAAASYDSRGRPLLSWRVQLLPSLGQDAVYRAFKLDEPWDSPHNKKLLAQMPPVYKGTLSRVSKEGKTVYLAPRGEKTMFPGATGVRISEVTDGTANTIFVVEADDAHAVEWTRPEDVTVDPANPAAGLNRGHPGGLMFLFVDGSVHLIPASIAPASLWALFTRNGGELVQW